MYVYIPLLCLFRVLIDGRYFYYILGTALFSCTNYGNFMSIVVFLLDFGDSTFFGYKLWQFHVNSDIFIRFWGQHFFRVQIMAISCQ